ncbi:peroxiredoxin [Calorimonas adulescens]|jgi:AhpC/TSA family.|uniref:thioredoxin-dependent peroxiredoxin n=1 Tax=Calorimonas adulescens TaxID=2606906 RepID=A0A5D8QB07_9THEO|nr:peroxiredoxin [Calorimonas adulescens]TZE81329.1 peroxiredoxin [Calorimonas adulescens]
MELKEGMEAPDFTLPSTDGNVTLSSLRGKNVVLYFYPKDNTSGCTNEAVSFRDKLRDFEDLNTEILGVSRDSIRSHENFASRYGLPFKLLSDSEGMVCELYGVLKEKNMYGKITIGIERTTFVIDRDGYIRKIFNKVKVNGHVDDVLEIVRSM